MPTFSDSIKEFINVAGLTARIKALEAELILLKQLQSSLGGKKRGRKPGLPADSKGKVPKAKTIKRGKHGKVKAAVLAYLEKNRQGKAIEIAKLSGLKVTSVNQTLFGLKKSGHVTQEKKRGSPFVLAKK
jgi:hypothetical protein